jgi:hypothetical protein
MLTTTQQFIKNKVLEKGCQLIEPIPEFKTSMISYICKCGETFTRRFKDFARRNCRNCNSKSLREMPKNENLKPCDTEEEIWKPTEGGWVSSLGNAVNSQGKKLKLCETKFRYHINGKNRYASNLVAIAFQILDYEKLGTEEYIVKHIDGDPKNNCLENLKVVSKTKIAC